MMTHTVDVTVEEEAEQDRRRIYLTSPYKAHKVRANPGDTVVWQFHNKSSHGLLLGIGNVRPSRRYRDDEHEYPLEPTTVLIQDVPPGKPVKLECKIRQKSKNLGPRTYEYDVIDFTNLRVLLDPEIEVP